MKDKMWKTRGILITALPEEVFCLNSLWFKNGTLLSHRAMHLYGAIVGLKKSRSFKVLMTQKWFRACGPARAGSYGGHWHETVS
jgi:hypothetical protein